MNPAAARRALRTAVVTIHTSMVRTRVYPQLTQFRCFGKKRKDDDHGYDVEQNESSFDDFFDEEEFISESEHNAAGEQAGDQDADSNAELLKILSDLESLEFYDEEDDGNMQSEGDGEESVILNKRERTLYKVNHINWEDNAKALGEILGDEPEPTREDIRFLPDPPAPEIRASLQPDVFTDVCVTKQDEKHIGMYYHMKNSEKLPGVLMKQLEPEFESSFGHTLMIRKAGLDLAADVEKGDGQVILIDGKRGCGKSATALYAAHYAQESGQLLLSCGMNDKYLWDDRLGRIDIKPIEGFAYPSVFAMPDMAQRYFHWLRDTYEEQMKAIVVKGDHGVEDYYDIKPWADELEQELNPTRKLAEERLVPDGERGAKPSLYDFLNYASQDRAIAATLTPAFFEEIRAINEMKVCIVMDEFNSLIINKTEKDSAKSEFMEVEVWRDIPRARLSLVDGFVSMAEKPPQNGTVIIAPTFQQYKRSGMERYKKYFVSKQYEVGYYSPEENKNAFLHYSLSTALEPVVQWEEFERIKGLTGRHPEEFRKFTGLGPPCREGAAFQ